MKSPVSTLTEWMGEQHLERFRTPIPLSHLAAETGLSVAQIRAHLASQEACSFAWNQCKLHCLRLNGPRTVGLDWEASLVGAVETEFRRHGYETRKEIGSPEHVAHIADKRSLRGLLEGVNKRDLVAMKTTRRGVDLWLIEAKGKQASGWEYGCCAEALAQMFGASRRDLSDLYGQLKLRSGKKAACWPIAERLQERWREEGVNARITLGLLLPAWRPDCVWGRTKRATPISASYYAGPIERIKALLECGRVEPSESANKKERAFCRMLNGLERKYQLSALAKNKSGLRFRLLLAGAPARGRFRVAGVR